jgi:hypothetical protein
MAAPSTPTQFTATQGNGQVALKWALTATATSYTIQRSTDAVSYSTLGTATLNNYLDTTCSVGTQYWYKVAAVNGSGASAYTAARTVVPAPSGEMSLLELRETAKLHADMANSQFITNSEWDGYINQSAYELYDMLITTFDDYAIAAPLTVNTNGSTSSYPLPNGTNYNAAPPFYKLVGVDLFLNAYTNGWVTVQKFNFIDRNKYIYPNSNSTIYGVANLSYRIMGNNIEFIPIPIGNQQFRVWYVPRMPSLIQDTDITTIGVSGWLEYVIIRAAILALNKEESDTSLLASALVALKQRIEASAQNRDAGRPDTISDTRTATLWGGWPSGRGGW